MPLNVWGAIKQYVFRPLGAVLGGVFITEAVFHVGETLAGETGVPPVAVDSLKAFCSTATALMIIYTSGNRSVTPAGTAIKTIIPAAVAIGAGIGAKFIAKSQNFPESTSLTSDQKELVDEVVATGTATIISTGLYALSSLYVDKKFQKPEDEANIEALNYIKINEVVDLEDQNPANKKAANENTSLLPPTRDSNSLTM